LFLSFQLVSRAGERREASTDPSLEWSGKEEKKRKKEGRIQAVAGLNQRRGTR
jgi:hypothetical protein